MVDGFCSSMLQTAASDFAAAYFAALCCRGVVAVSHVFYNESWYIHKCAPSLSFYCFLVSFVLYYLVLLGQIRMLMTFYFLQFFPLSPERNQDAILMYQATYSLK